MAPVIAIIGALEREVRHIYAALEHGSTVDEAGLHIVRGAYRGVDVVATVAGMGTVNAAAATQHLISAYGAGTVIFSGIAGGLNPALHIGDVVIGERLRYLDTDTALIAESAPELEEFASTDALVGLAEDVLRERGYHNAAGAGTETAADGGESVRYLRGTIASGDRFITGADVKKAVIEATHADCVEMEGAAIAHIAAKNGADCLVLRAISDNCDEAYDALSNRVFDLDDYAKSASMLVLSIVDRLAAAASTASRS